jgi:histidine triad (HIT) family protein
MAENKTDCLFCKIINKDIPARLAFESDRLLAFDDINPQAPVHKLIIPKQHIATINDLTATEQNLIGELFLTAKQLAAEAGIAENGYRTVLNCNADGGQAVYHIHLHLLGGRQMTWPPG